MRDNRPDYPPEFDEPDASEWEGSRFGDYGRILGIEPTIEAMRCTEKYGEEGASVSVRLPNGEMLQYGGSPRQTETLQNMRPDEPVAAWIVHGIAWDGSDWEWGTEVKTAEEIAGALTAFAEALEEYRAERDAEDPEGYLGC